MPHGPSYRAIILPETELMTPELAEGLAELAELDPAEVPDAADEITETLATQLEASDEPEGSPAD